jgi:ubiquinone/menaquinone biosynthesis C-methylase UbiE
MVKVRIKETDSGITGEFETEAYDMMMRSLRDKGWLETNYLIKSDITSGLALEIGPGPGYLGLEWLKHTENTRLNGMDISNDMLNLARKNAEEYGLSHRTEYFQGNASSLPFMDNYFDAAFTNGSLHEWEHPDKIMNEIFRVLKPGGKYVITDLRRDMFPVFKWLMRLTSKPRIMREGLTSSINAAYTQTELMDLIRQTGLKDGHVSQNLIGLTISGQKPG